ncbi:MAG: RsiV family protein [Candidatus Kaiserbacteria bacterium]|nr:RsiV family protein [Candidatus Kaiserbacteria bacterium]
MRYYIQNLIVFTAIALTIIFSYLSVSFTPQDTQPLDPITTACDSNLLLLETGGVASIENRYLRTVVREKMQTAANLVCASAQLFAADPESQGSALLPFRFSAHAEYHTHKRTRSVRVQFYEETGGAHGNIDYYTQTVTTRNDPVTLTDLLSSHAISEDDFIRMVTEDLTVSGDIPFLTPFSSIDQAQHWHITDRGVLTVTFPPYALAPYSYGTLEATVDLTSQSAANGT